MNWAKKWSIVHPKIFSRKFHEKLNKNFKMYSIIFNCSLFWTIFHKNWWSTPTILIKKLFKFLSIVDNYQEYNSASHFLWKIDPILDNFSTKFRKNYSFHTKITEKLCKKFFAMKILSFLHISVKKFPNIYANLFFSSRDRYLLYIIKARKLSVLFRENFVLFYFIPRFFYLPTMRYITKKYTGKMCALRWH